MTSWLLVSEATTDWSLRTATDRLYQSDKKTNRCGNDVRLATTPRCPTLLRIFYQRINLRECDTSPSARWSVGVSLRERRKTHDNEPPDGVVQGVDVVHIKGGCPFTRYAHPLTNGKGHPLPR